MDKNERINRLNNFLDKNFIQDFMFELREMCLQESLVKISRMTKLGRESLYKSLHPQSNISLSTLKKILKSLNLTVEISCMSKIKPNLSKPSRESFLNLYPSIAIQWHPTMNLPEKLEDISIHSRKQALWICDCGYIWKQTIRSRITENKIKNYSCNH